MLQDPCLDLKNLEKTEEELFDVIIIGGGPAGLAAGLYTSRANLKSLLLEKDPTGCGICWIKNIENYPGFPDGISGKELISLMQEQAKGFGLQIEIGSVIDITNCPEGKIVKTDTKNYMAKTLIITTGVSRKRDGVDGEEEFTGRGVSYCATCDGAFFRDVSVLVVGGGDEALEEAIFLTKFANHVTIIHSQEELPASEKLQKMANDNDKINIFTEKKVLKIAGKDKVEFAEVMDLNSGDVEQIETNGVFLYIGTRPAKDFLSQIVEMDERGYVITDEEMKTNVEGIFAAGDIRYKKVRQVATAVGDGVTAATSARKFIQKL
ncbi:thioredoxin-disulfide reductase [Candidatus Poribacteria bacterium]|nr:thioredoxin-disulfide reductase [Candidatus Poribacteria bacterium]